MNWFRSCIFVAAGVSLLAGRPAHAADHWIRINTTHFEMYTDSDEKKAREAILHFERVRDFFLQASPVKPPAEFPVRIVAFKDPQVFHLFAPNPSVAAYFVPGPLRDTIAMGEPTTANYPITIHEYVHLVIAHSGLRIPLWLNEGWAEVYSTLKPVKDGVAVGDLKAGHMADLQRGEWFPLRQLAAINTHSPEYNESNRTGMFYAESWALAHMLYLSPDYKDNFPKFVSALNRGADMDTALQTAFSKSSDQVLTDLRGYFARKNLFGTVFLTPFEKSGEKVTVMPTDSYDSDLMQADLYSAGNHFSDAERIYRQLEQNEPRRPDAFAGHGYLALLTKDPETARKEFRKAFANGSTDAQLCMQLAVLDREAQEPAPRIVEALERAIQLRPDFAEAIFELGMMKLDTRDFATAAALLKRVSDVAPARRSIFHAARAYAVLETGDVATARQDIDAARKTATSPAETQRAEQLARLTEARSRGLAATQPGEKLVRAEGTAIGMRCETAGTLSKLGILVDGKQVLFDVPEAAAVELAPHPGTKGEIKCGVMQPFRVLVEFVPAKTMGEATAGLIRRLEY